MTSRTGRDSKVFLGPVEIAGYYSGLHAGLRDLGVDACAVDVEPHPFQYRPLDSDPWIVRMVRWVGNRRQAPGGNSVLRGPWFVAWAMARIVLLAWAAVRFDVFIMSAGVSLFRGYDLPLLRMLGKRLIFIFHGSDARPAYIDGQFMAPERGATIDDCVAFARWQKHRISHIERYADVIVAQPAIAHFFERPVVNWFAIGVPWRDRPGPQPAAPRAGSPVRVLHSPSDTSVKGSGRIREAVEQLRAEGVQVQLVELSGVPNDVVLEEVGRCDFVVDQLFSDAPMVGFATEAAVAGRPALVGSYAWATNRLAFGSLPFPPVEECAPEDVVDAIRRLAIDVEHRTALGRDASAFVHAHWSRAQIAGRMLELIEGPPRTEWMYNPQDLRYVEGCGLTRDQARDLVAAVLRVGGREALRLTDKPELEAAFIEFAASTPGHTAENGFRTTAD